MSATSSSSVSSCSTPSEASPIEQLQQQLDAKSRLLDATSSRLQYAELKIQLLEEELRQRRIEKFGPKSDTFPSAQLELLEAEPGVSAEEVEAEAQREPVTSDKEQSRKQHPGRQALPADLARVERVLACTDEQRVCARCNEECAVIGYDESEQLDVKPAEYFVVRTRREKRACPRCKDASVVAAPLAAQIIPKSLVSDRIVVDTVVSKYVAHLPLYRQSMLLERDTGLAITRATMDGWVMRVGELLLPIARMMRSELLRGTYIQADETPVAVQMHDRSGSNHQSYLWQYGAPGRSVVFDFRMGRAREGPKQFLEHYDGLLQTDGYAAYDHVGGTHIVHAACWSHVRRKFVDALKLHPKDEIAARLLAPIDQLFAIDAIAREQELSHEQRHQRRQQESASVLQTLRGALEQARPQVLPASATGKAIAYTLALWRKLIRFLEYPELELSNNLAENSMRPIAIGRRNWIHFGHPNAGPKIAAILSVLESCRRLRINPRHFLTTILPGLASASIHSLHALTPAAYAHTRTQHGFA